MELEVDVIESWLSIQRHHFRNARRCRELKDQIRAGGRSQRDGVIDTLTADPGFLFLAPVPLGLIGSLNI